MRYRPCLLLTLLTISVLAGCRTPQDPKLTMQLSEISQMDISLPDSSNVGRLNREQAIDRASASSDKIAELVATVNVVSKEKLAAGDIRDPELRLGLGNDEGDADRVLTTSDRSAYSLALRIFPRNPWTRDARLTAGRARIFAAVADLLQARWELSSDVRRLFAELHFLDQDKALMDELTEIYRLAVENTRHGLEQGQTTVADVMTASRRHLGTMSNRDEVTRRWAEARRDLAGLVAVPTDALEVSFEGTPSDDLPLDRLTTAALEAQALNNRRDLAALYWRKASAKATLREAKTERRPWLTFVEGTYGKSESSMNRQMLATDVNAAEVVRSFDETVTADDGEEEEWGIRTGVTLPLFPLANHLVDVRQAEYRRAAIKELRAREQVRREIQDAARAVTDIADARETYKNDTKPLIQEMSKVLEGIESAGLDPTDVARLKGQILESKRLNLETELEYRLAVIELENVLGLRLGDIKTNH